MTDRKPRRVVAWCTVSIDGFSSGPGGPANDTWLHQHVLAPQAEAYFETVWRRSSTVVMGRTNAEGFGAVWPGMAVSPDLSESSRAYGRFLVEVEKIGISRSLPADGLDGFDWVNARVSADLEAEIESLRQRDGRDILVQNSASVIRQLLWADLVDDLRLVVVPVLLNGGLRLLDHGEAAEGAGESRWTLRHSATFDSGAIAVHYARSRH